MVLGGRAFDVPIGARQPQPARRRTRGDCIQSVACNESKSLVLHSGITPFAPHALRTLTPHSALRTHRTTVTPSAHPPSCARTHQAHCFSLLMLSFLLPSYHARTSFALVSLTLTMLTMSPDQMNSLEYAAYVRFALFMLMAGCAILTAALWAPIYCEWRKSNRK